MSELISQFEETPSGISVERNDGVKATSRHGGYKTGSKLHDALTKLTLKAGIGVFKLWSFLKAAPFELESSDSFRVRKFQRRWKLVAWHLGNWLYYFAATFQFVTFIIHTLTPDTKGNAFVLHTIYLMDCLFGLVFMLSVYMKPDACILMLCQQDNLLRRIKDLGVEVPKWSSFPYVILTANYMAYAMANVWFMQVCAFPLLPRSPCYLYNYLPRSYQTTTTLLICWMYEIVWPALGMSTVTAFYFYWCADIFTFNSTLSALLKKKTWTDNDLKAYKYLQIFCETFNDFNGSFFNVGFTFALVLLPIIYIYEALTLQNLHIVVFLVLPGFAIFNITLIVIFLPQHSKVCILSERLLKVIKRGTKTTIGAEIGSGLLRNRTTRDQRIRKCKQIMAFRPLGIRIWFFAVCTLATTDVLMEQLFTNILLLMSL